jgi:diacylglycerol kinase (ATP)
MPQLIDVMVRPACREYEIVYIQGPGDGARLSREAVARGCDMVAAVGGDGTVNAVAQGLVNTPAALAVVSTGSGNGFARSMGIPLDQRAALRLLLSTEIIPVDAGRINDRYFFNMAGIGLDAAISKSFEQHGRRGMLTYFLAGVKTFFACRPAPVIIRQREETQACLPLVISIANGPQYGSGAIIAPRARIDDGLLDVCILDKLSLWRAAANLYRLFNGTIERMRGYRSFQTSSLTIERPEPGLIHLDGEPHMAEALLRITVAPGSLNVAAGVNSAARAAGMVESGEGVLPR